MPHYRNPADAVGLGRDPALARLLRACGMDEALITGGASDYDKFLALAEAMPLCEGHPLRETMDAALREATGVNAPLCPHTARDMWAAWTDIHWYGREPATRDLPAVCPHCRPCVPTYLTEGGLTCLPEPVAVASENLGVWTRELESLLAAAEGYPVCALPADYTFVRPDPYHAGEVLRRVAGGETVTLRDRDLLLTQALRVWGQSAVRRGMTLYVRGGAPDEVVRLLAYLESSRALPQMYWIPDVPADAGVVCGLYACVGTGLDLSRCKTDEERAARMSTYAAVAPLGCAVAVRG